ncbi:MAG: DUF5050 domain-containing protein [Lachnospiraceae bacterium]|nr:DUF5050 domain-containing protein [Lachnospiraceae bacterium]
MTSRKDQVKLIFIIFLIMVFISFIVFLQMMDFTPDNDITATGNTAGNLYNGGYFCEYNDDIYFSWPADDHAIYCMKKDGSLSKTRVTDAFSINIYNDYLYYGRNAAKGKTRSFLDGRPFGVYRVSLKSGRSKSLCNSLSAYICLCGNNLFLQEYTDTSLYFSRVDVKDSKDFERISSIGYPISCADNGYLYYAELEENHNIYRYDSRTGATELFYEGSCYQPIYENGFLYFIDLADGYALKRYNVSSQEITVITNDRCINYNVSDSVILYQIENPDTNHYALYRNNTAGTEEELVAKESCNHINIAGDYAYFQYFTNKYAFYRVNLLGPLQVEEFKPDIMNIK